MKNALFGMIQTGVGPGRRLVELIHGDWPVSLVWEISLLPGEPLILSWAVIPCISN